MTCPSNVSMIFIRPPQQGQAGGWSAALSWCRAQRHRTAPAAAAVEQSAVVLDLLHTMTIGEQAIVSNTMEAVRQDVQEKATDELPGSERHHLGSAALSVVLPTKADCAVGY